ncbi:unnamed protein product [Closterium sp. NIES-54]
MEIPREDFERVMFFEQTREQAMAEFKKNPHDADVSIVAETVAGAVEDTVAGRPHAGIVSGAVAGTVAGSIAGTVAERGSVAHDGNSQKSLQYCSSAPLLPSDVPPSVRPSVRPSPRFPSSLRLSVSAHLLLFFPPPLCAPQNLTKLGRTLVELAQFIQGQEANGFILCSSAPLLPSVPLRI